MEKCNCVEKWMEEAKRKFNAKHIHSDIPYNSEGLSIKRIVIPKSVYARDKGIPRLSKHWLCVESKDFKFCPHCGKPLQNVPKINKKVRNR